MKRKPRGWVWICRDAETGSNYKVYASLRRPKLVIKQYIDNREPTTLIRQYAEWNGHGRLLDMCAQGFEGVMGYRIPPGGCEKVRISLSAMWRGRSRLVR